MPALELAGIRKSFGSVHALRGADFTLVPGEVHALLGENGAGKTTLMRIAAGLIQPDGGMIRIGVPARRGLSPRTARRLGVGMVHQHPTSVPAFTVAENVALAAGWPVAPGPLRRRVRELAERTGLPLDPDAVTERLSVGLRQRLEIVRALAADARILLLDEPTAVLAPAEVADLIGVIRRFTARGGAAVLITHKLDEALAAADRVTVLRRGEVVLTGPVTGQTPATLAAAMLGEAGVDERQRTGPPTPAPGGKPLVRLERLDVAREGGLGMALRGASLSVTAGEIVGIAAVEGNGQRELLRAVAGRVHALRGLRDVAAPVAFIPEDRTTEGLIPEMTLTENVVLGSTGSESWLRGGSLDWSEAGARTAELLDQYAVEAPGPGAPAGSLSGGNQQRLVIARELARSPAVVVAENPTRGLDLRATAAVHSRLRRAAAGGAAVLFHSSDLDEVLALATRVLVARRGALVEPAADATREEIGALMLAGG
ncbi:MAG TPA: ATP-binding cassette domain-containing protein [Gemmatimonadales bacterium]|jgi:simple sugar transport system ATP-binding protein|nr:ATP-binding cassette domain-containing protein [Gemmatimonadales bacterium]